MKKGAEGGGNTPHTPSCTECGEWVHSKRWALGYTLCRACGELAARRQRAGWTIAPVGKSNYVLVSNVKELKGLNPKRNEM